MLTSTILNFHINIPNTEKKSCGSYNSKFFATKAICYNLPCYVDFIARKFALAAKTSS